MQRIVLLFIFSLLLSVPTQVYAAKARVRTAPKSARSATGTYRGYSTAKLSRSTNSIQITFVNFSLVKSVTYTLSYTANGISQGVVGTVTPTGAPTESRDLYFGTCSHGVCTAHRGIQNATLLVETTLTNGKVNVKRYRIRI